MYQYCTVRLYNLRFGCMFRSPFYIVYITYFISELQTGNRIERNSCQLPNKTAYVYPDQIKAEVKLADGNVTWYSPGEHRIQQQIGSTVCSYYVVVQSKYYI